MVGAGAVVGGAGIADWGAIAIHALHSMPGALLNGRIAMHRAIAYEVVVEADRSLRNGNGIGYDSVHAHHVMIQFRVLPDLAIPVHALHSNKAAPVRIIV